MGTNVNDAGADVKPRSSLLAQFMEKVGMTTGASIVYGEPVERDGVTIIPVARARWLAGGGGGGDDRQGNPAGGAGGGSTVTPVGYIEIKNSVVRYKNIFDATSILRTIFISTIALGLILRWLRRFLR